MGLPHLDDINNALDFHPDKNKGELIKVSQDLAKFRVKFPSELHTVPTGWNVLTLKQLVEMRVADMEAILDNIPLETEDAAGLIAKIRQHSGDILPAVRSSALSWLGRYNTSTVTQRAGNGNDALIINVSQENFRDPHLVKDYKHLVDGGVQLTREEIPGEVVGEIPGNVYGNRESVAGGDKSLKQLFSHPVVSALIPDETLRRKYLAALGTLNALGFFKTGSNSIWVPDKLPAWFFRWNALGFEADAFYPPNMGTEYFELFLQILEDFK